MSIESQFSYLHHWCLDTQPSPDDDNLRTLQWLTIANTVSKHGYQNHCFKQIVQLHQPIQTFSKDEKQHINDLETPSQ